MVLGRVHVHGSLKAMVHEMSARGKDIGGWSLSRVKQDLIQASQ